jgi:hypothetical protein
MSPFGGSAFRIQLYSFCVCIFWLISGRNMLVNSLVKPPFTLNVCILLFVLPDDLTCHWTSCYVHQSAAIAALNYLLLCSVYPLSGAVLPPWWVHTILLPDDFTCTGHIIYGSHKMALDLMFPLYPIYHSKAPGWGQK